MSQPALVPTGGTIQAAGRPLTPMPMARFRRLWRQAGLPAADWHPVEPPLDSTEIGPAGWLRIARAVLAAADGEPAGIAVLHGTDTLAHTGAALAMLTTLVDPGGAPAARLAVPIHLTGAMRPLFDGEAVDPASDASGNVEAALGGFGAPGLRVVFGGESLPGARVAKLDTARPRAFAAPNGEGTLAPLHAAAPAELRDQLAALAPHLGRRDVLTVLATPGDDDARAAALRAQIDALGSRLGALHLLGYGAGTMPGGHALAPVLARAAEQGVLVAVGSQVPCGAVSVDAYAAGAWMEDAGAFGTGDMTVPAAHAKLRVVLALAACHGWSAARMRRAVLTPFAGEITAPDATA